MRNFKKIAFSAPGKVIISGEHAVVYGYPALVAAIDRRVFLNLTFNHNGRYSRMLGWKKKLKSKVNFAIESEVPWGCGLGSSAALAAVEAAALTFIIGAKTLNKEKINEIAYSLEKVAHGQPSGVDNTVCVYGGMLFYQKDKGFKSLKFKSLPRFLLIDTGKPAETTREIVENLKFKMQSRPGGIKIKKLLDSMGQLPKQFVQSLRYDDRQRLALLIKRNERLLEELGVVGEKTRKIIRQIEALGGAAKICGAGGVKQGSGIALVYHPNLKVIEKFCRENKLAFYQVKLGEVGLKQGDLSFEYNGR